ncbi:helix-turn-helix domain-containing protein [Actinomadura spongiicola]|uniref:Helix-turn-helix domain-containing protein n=1 Tax=Actinomadura spongiicola TaxID=2303421 RepID=A0A372G9L5_9ACTN|nr:helix-turn-helix domain-containing protein [Actinomadura spongiicola]RFS82088.1 helix-turn-helix domain-containing protein [Actinomadura spongiicola]
MTTLRLTTDDLPPTDRFPYWYDVALSTQVPCYLRNPKVADFHASLDAVNLGEVQISQLKGAPMQSFRTAKLIRSGDTERYELFFVLHGTIGIATKDHRSMLEPGQSVLLDTHRPAEGWQESRYGRVLMVGFPRTALRLPTRAIDDMIPGSLDVRTGLGAVLLSHLQQVLRQADTYTNADRSALAKTTLDLTAAAFAHRLDIENTVNNATRRKVLLAEIYHFIDQQLADPNLSPAAIAAAHRISVRYLYKLFESEDMTIGAWIRRQRLQRCHRDLADPLLAARPVHAIAARWGIIDRAHFTRIFRTAYGMTPGEFRQTVHSATG